MQKKLQLRGREAKISNHFLLPLSISTSLSSISMSRLLPVEQQKSIQLKLSCEAFFQEGSSVAQLARPRTALLFLQQRLPGQSRYRHGFKIMHDGFQMFWDAQVAVQIQIYGT